MIKSIISTILKNDPFPLKYLKYPQKFNNTDITLMPLTARADLTNATEKPPDTVLMHDCHKLLIPFSPFTLMPISYQASKLFKLLHVYFHVAPQKSTLLCQCVQNPNRCLLIFLASFHMMKGYIYVAVAPKRQILLLPMMDNGKLEDHQKKATASSVTKMMMRAWGKR
jgi:hypothetical protein